MSNAPNINTKRVSKSEILDLMQNAPLKELGKMASDIRDRLHPQLVALAGCKQDACFLIK